MGMSNPGVWDVHFILFLQTEMGGQMRPPPSCISAIKPDLTHCTNEPIFSPIPALRKA